MQLKNRKLIFYIFVIVFCLGLLFLFFNEYGIIKYWSLQSEVRTLNENIEQLDADNKSLEAEIDSLKRKEPAKIEKTAREKYGMIREGEKTIEVIEE